MVAGAASPLLTAPIGPTIFRLAAPNMIAMVVTMVTLMAEAWFVGQLGTGALAGPALGFPMTMLSAGSFGGTITGAVARRLGAGDRAGAELVALHAVFRWCCWPALAHHRLGSRGMVVQALVSGTAIVPDDGARPACTPSDRARPELTCVHPEKP